MPLYDYECGTCEAQFEENHRIADRGTAVHCGRTAKLLVGASAPAAHVFKPMWAENIASEPVFVRTKKQYKEECKKRGKLCLGL